jgi:hypothetical protein
MNLEWQKYLTHHGKTKEVCEYVVYRFDRPEYDNNKGIKIWVEASKSCLKDTHGV